MRAAANMTMALVNRREVAQAAGWIARCRRLLDGRPDCVEVGYVMAPAAIMTLRRGDHLRAADMFKDVIAVAERFDDADLLAIGRLGRAQALITAGDLAGGLELFDEDMVAVTSGELFPVIAGIVYCAVIDGCRSIYDHRRAREWTAALDQWCQSQPGIVPFRGNCLVFRSEIKQMDGAWGEALAEANEACQKLSQPNSQHAAGDAFYQLGELLRLRGDFAAAEAAYRRASELGHAPQPGLGLVRLATGHIDAAATAMRREREEAREVSRKCAVLPAFVDVMVASGDVGAARQAVDELIAIADQLGAPFLRARAMRARGSVMVAAGEHRDALESLRESLALWQDIDAPYEAAKTRALIGLACNALGDADAGQLEFEAARKIFTRLGAKPDLAALQAGPGARTAGLSPREVEVLRLLAAGKSNRAIAGQLFISEKTVARHLSNIFTKLDVPSRSAAIAFAYEHGLAAGRT